MRSLLNSFYEVMAVMLCPERDELAAYCNGSLPEESAAAVEQHLEDCDECVGRLEELEQAPGSVLQVLRRVSQIDHSPQDSWVAPRSALDAPSRDPFETRFNPPAGRPETGEIDEPAHPSNSTAPDAGFRAAAGATLGVYRLTEKLGEGGMGAVWRATHTLLQKTVAIKILPPRLTRDAEHVARFEREMRAVGRFQHPNIVVAHDAGCADGVHYLVMECVEGVNLSRLVRETGPLSVAEALDVLRQAAAALSHAHKNGLVHRDVKPSNLMRAADGTIKLLDLGLARLLPDTAIPVAEPMLTVSGQLLGTPDFMAPEQCENTAAIDSRADLYALGGTLHFLLIGKPPFSGPATTSVARKLAAHLLVPAPDLRRDRPDVPNALANVYSRLMAKSPDDRFATADELLAALENVALSPDAPLLKSPVDESESPTVTLANANTAEVADRPDRENVPQPISADSFGGKTDPEVPIAVDSSAGSRRKPIRIGLAALAVVLLAAFVLKIRTTAGMVILEFDEPAAGAEVLVDDERRIVLGSGPDAVTIEADGRERVLKVTKPGFETFTDRVTLTRENPKRTIRVRLERGPDAPVVGGSKPASTSPAKSPPVVKTPSAATATAGTVASAGGWHGWPADAPKPAIAPFSADQAEDLQRAWARYLNVPVDYENSLGMKFRLIPPGEFLMGSTPEEIAEALAAVDKDEFRQKLVRSEGPQRKVVLTHPLYVGNHEVTQKQYREIMGTNPSGYQTGLHEALYGELPEIDTREHPVEKLSFRSIGDFCARLSAKEGLRPCYLRLMNRHGDRLRPLHGDGYRLPSEAEWEFFARAGTLGRTFFAWEGDDAGEKELGEQAQIGTHHPMSVGQKKPNPFGLFDVLGNVAERCEDGFDVGYWSGLDGHDAVNPVAPIEFGEDRELPRLCRGGHWGSKSRELRCASRNHFDPGLDSCVGMRLVLSAEAVRDTLRRKGPSLPPRPSPAWKETIPRPAVAPFSADDARRLQSEWAAYLRIPAEIENSLGMRFRLMPPGEFDMGSTPEEIDWALNLGQANHDQIRQQIRSEAPRHRVVLTQPFYVGMHEVTQGQYEALRGKNPSSHSANGPKEFAESLKGLDTSRRPVESVTWTEANEFCALLAEKEATFAYWTGRVPPDKAGTPQRFLNGVVYRLPTEAEWEFFARAGTTTRWWCGDDPGKANVADVGPNITAPVGSRLPNPFQLFDLHGNVSEWCLDRFGLDDYAKRAGRAAVDPNNAQPRPQSAGHIHRGGTLYDGWSARRYDEGDDTRKPHLGFRVVLTFAGSRDLFTKE